MEAIMSCSSTVPSSSQVNCPPPNAKEKYADRMKRLRDLHIRRNEARTLNHAEVAEEDRRLKLPANWQAKQARAEWQIEEDAKKKEAAEKGENYERNKMLQVSADEAERFERKKKKKNVDPGFSNFEDATLRQYNRLVKQLKPDMDAYEVEKQKLGESFYSNPNTIMHGLHKDTPESVDRMVQDLEKQIDRRQKYSRRRMHNDDADIDYINERNMKFNKKLDRYYGEYTTEIKQNLERGTAV